MKVLFYGSGESEFGYFYSPEIVTRKGVLVVFIHGGFWRDEIPLDYFSDMAAAVQNSGLYAWQIEYVRILPRNSPKDTLQSVIKALKFVKTLEKEVNEPFKKIVLVGHSAGGQLAMWLAQNKDSFELPIEHVISLAGVLDLKEMERVAHLKEMVRNREDNPVREFLREEMHSLREFSPIELLPIGVNQTLIHGTLDIEVPVGLSMNYMERAKEFDTVVLHIKNDAEHYGLVDAESKEGKEVVQTIIETCNNLD